MSYRSKYDKYWIQKVDELIKAVNIANTNGISIINISDIVTYGERKPESWCGKIILCKDTIIRDSALTHLKSLGRILLTYRVLKNYNSYFSFKISRDLKLEIKRMSIDVMTNHRSSSAAGKEHKEHPVINRKTKFRETPLGVNCKCDTLFCGFLWHELSTLKAHDLPKEPGVYVIRIIKKGEETEKAKHKLEDVISKTNWKELISYVNSRLNRITRIENCPVIYIGSTSDIRTRYRDLAGIRHTAFFPILALLLCGWELDYGFKTVPSKKDAKHLEDELKRKYEDLHGMLPALVEE
ncbi:MAG: DUF7664 domain-containing protein [Candidatus Baldrarchaeia archaeon]